MTIKGGIVVDGNSVEVKILVKGGKSYVKVYDEEVATAINKFDTISTMINKLFIEEKGSSEYKFYIDQLMQLFHKANIEFLNGDMEFQLKYNSWLLDGYIRMLVETADMKLIIQMLGLDSILYSIEEADAYAGTSKCIEFDVPPSTKKIQSNAKSKLSLPANDSIEAYLHASIHNLGSLRQIIKNNESTINTVYKHIVKTGLACFD